MLSCDRALKAYRVRDKWKLEWRCDWWSKGFLFVTSGDGTMRFTETESILIFTFAFRHQNWMACFAFTSDAVACQILLLSDLCLKFSHIFGSASCKSHMLHIPTYNSPPIWKSGSTTRRVSWHGLSKAIFLQSQKICILSGIIWKKPTTLLSLVHLTQSPTYHLLIFSLFFYTPY